MTLVEELLQLMYNTLVNNGIDYEPQLVFPPEFWTVKNSITLQVSLVSTLRSSNSLPPGLLHFYYLEGQHT